MPIVIMLLLLENLVAVLLNPVNTKIKITASMINKVHLKNDVMMYG